MSTTSFGTRSLLLGMLACVSLLSAPVFVYAQATGDPTGQAKTDAVNAALTAQQQQTSSFFNDITGQGLGQLTGQAKTDALNAAFAAQQTQSNATARKIIGAPGAILKCADDLGNCLLNAVAYFALGFANFVLGVVGVLLNWVVVKTVFQFSQVVGNSSGLIASWKILRDVGNLLLLFGFVLMGIGTILETSKLPDKKAIPLLIVFAILLNFSIFAAEAVIDTSNVLTSVLYAQANTSPCATTTCDINNGLAGKIMESTGLSGVFALKGGQDINSSANKTIIIVGLALFSIIGTVVLLAAAIMLAWRAVVLIGIIILSPIGFAGMALPPLKKYAQQWWSALIHQSFFAPILFLLIFIDLRVTESFSALSNNNNLASALVGATGTDNMGIIMIFMLIIGGLVAALMAAKAFGAYGADFAVSTAAKMTFGAQNVGFGVAGRVLRNASQRIPGDKDTLLRRQLASTGRWLEHGGLDARGLPGIGKGIQTGLSRAGASAESLKKHDSLADVETAVKASPLNLVRRGREDRAKYDAEIAENKAFDSRQNLLQKIKSSDPAVADEAKRNLAKQSVKTLEQMKEIKRGDADLIDNLSTDQYEGLMKSDALSDAEKGEIRGARYKPLETAITTGPAAVKAQLNRMSKNDLESMPPAMMTNRTVLEQLSDKQREDLAGSNKRTASEKQAIRDASPNKVFETDFNAAVTPAAKTLIAVSMAGRLTIPQVGKLDNAVLANPIIAEQLTPAMLAELQEQKKLKAADITAIGALIRASETAKGHASMRGPAGALW